MSIRYILDRLVKGKFITSPANVSSLYLNMEGKCETGSLRDVSFYIDCSLYKTSFV